MQDVDGFHPGLISFTTGSTGTPKGIERSHVFLAAQNDAVAPLLQPDQPETDLVAFPVFVIANLALGITSVLPPWGAKAHRATPHALSQIIEKETITRALLPPSICETLVESENGHRLSALFTGGGPIFPDIRAGALGAVQICSVTSIPLDRRHHSKVDQKELARQLGQAD